jgi:predicted RNase H-like HicB family nuclease
VAPVRRPRYRVILERDQTGAWIARVPSVPGCHTHARTLERVRRRVREALALWVDNANDAELVEEVRLPPKAREVIRRSRRARRDAAEQRAEAHAATADAACALVRDFDLGMRDTGELLGLSHQRVQQLVRG